MIVKNDNDDTFFYKNFNKYHHLFHFRANSLLATFYTFNKCLERGLLALHKHKRA